jgi:tetratricopeptide (TPR) repeat protein
MAPKPAEMNPYIAGKALGQSHGFFGRSDVLHLVENELASPDRNALVLFGQRRIGKTSILLQLRRRLPKEPYCTVYFDLMDRAHDRLGKVLAAIASAIAAEAGMPRPKAEAFDDAGEHFQRAFLPEVYRYLGEDRRPVLLLDEFDVLDGASAEKAAQETASRAFFPYLRRLLQEESKLAFVFVVGRKTEELSTDFLAAFKSARYQRVSVLDRESSEELIRTAERQGSIEFAPDAVESVYTLTNGHPYCTQLVCQLLWETAHRHRRDQMLTITSGDVEQIIPKALEAGENIFQWIWDGLPPAERVILSAVAKATEASTTVTESELLSTLQGNGIRILTRELALGPSTLVEWEMLTKTADGKYRFFIEMMRQWVLSRKPLPKVKDELDRIVPLADQYYRTGEMAYRQGNLQDAADQLERALKANPNHLKARLMLGEARSEMGDLTGAVREFQEAYSYDEDAARYPLIRALLSQGGALAETGKKEEEALSLFEQVLTISPQEVVANDRIRAIWSGRGERLAARGDWDEARQAFEKAGASERVAAMVQEEKRVELRRTAEKAVALIEEEAFGEAEKLLEKLIEIDPEHAEWQDRLAQVRLQRLIREKYAEGRGAEQDANYQGALRAFLVVVQGEPHFRDAASRLAHCIDRLRPPEASRAISAFLAWMAVMFGEIALTKHIEQIPYLKETGYIIQTAGGMFAFGMLFAFAAGAAHSTFRKLPVLPYFCRASALVGLTIASTVALFSVMDWGHQGWYTVPGQGGNFLAGFVFFSAAFCALFQFLLKRQAGWKMRVIEK